MVLIPKTFVFEAELVELTWPALEFGSVICQFQGHWNKECYFNVASVLGPGQTV